MTDLLYLGEQPDLRAVETARREAKAEYAFGWVRIDYPKSPNQRCMVAWVPGYTQCEFGVWPVYEGHERPDLDGRTSWRWDGNLEKPSLQPSILHTVRKTVDGKERQTCHGFVRQGQWDPC